MHSKHDFRHDYICSKTHKISPNFVKRVWRLGLRPRPHHYAAQQNSSFIVPTVCKYYVESRYIKHVDLFFIILREVWTGSSCGGRGAHDQPLAGGGGEFEVMPLDDVLKARSQAHGKISRQSRYYGSFVEAIEMNSTENKTSMNSNKEQKLIRNTLLLEHR